MNRAVMGGLAVVALCAAVLSFVSLTSLAVRCGFDPLLGWLLPLVVDAGAAVATAIWLRTNSRFARGQALILLAVSVVGNGLDHYLAAYRLEPQWWLVVAVAAIAPATLGATIHLARQGMRDDAEPVSVPQRSDNQDLTERPAPVVEAPEPDEEAELAQTMTVAEFAAHRLEAGSTAGVKKLRKHYSDLTEHAARQVSETARREHAARHTPRLVIGGER